MEVLCRDKLIIWVGNTTALFNFHLRVRLSFDDLVCSKDDSKSPGATKMSFMSRFGIVH